MGLLMEFGIMDIIVATIVSHEELLLGSVEFGVWSIYEVLIEKSKSVY
jgi:hypothetical protein